MGLKDLLASVAVVEEEPIEWEEVPFDPVTHVAALLGKRPVEETNPVRRMLYSHLPQSPIDAAALDEAVSTVIAEHVLQEFGIQAVMQGDVDKYFDDMKNDNADLVAAYMGRGMVPQPTRTTPLFPQPNGRYHADAVVAAGHMLSVFAVYAEGISSVSTVEEFASLLVMDLLAQRSSAVKDDTVLQAVVRFCVPELDVDDVEEQFRVFSLRSDAGTEWKKKIGEAVEREHLSYTNALHTLRNGTGYEFALPIASSIEGRQLVLEQLVEKNVFLLQISGGYAENEEFVKMTNEGTKVKRGTIGWLKSSTQLVTPDGEIHRIDSYNTKRLDFISSYQQFSEGEAVTVTRNLAWQLGYGFNEYFFGTTVDDVPLESSGRVKSVKNIEVVIDVDGSEYKFHKTELVRHNGSRDINDVMRTVAEKATAVQRAYDAAITELETFVQEGTDVMLELGIDEDVVSAWYEEIGVPSSLHSLPVPLSGMLDCIDGANIKGKVVTLREQIEGELGMYFNWPTIETEEEYQELLLTIEERVLDGYERQNVALEEGMTVFLPSSGQVGEYVHRCDMGYRADVDGDMAHEEFVIPVVGRAPPYLPMVVGEMITLRPSSQYFGEHEGEAELLDAFSDEESWVRVRYTDGTVDRYQNCDIQPVEMNEENAAVYQAWMDGTSELQSRTREVVERVDGRYAGLREQFEETLNRKQNQLWQLGLEPKVIISLFAKYVPGCSDDAVPGNNDAGAGVWVDGY